MVAANRTGEFAANRTGETANRTNEIATRTGEIIAANRTGSMTERCEKFPAYLLSRSD